MYNVCFVYMLCVHVCVYECVSAVFQKDGRTSFFKSDQDHISLHACIHREEERRLCVVAEQSACFIFLTVALLVDFSGNTSRVLSLVFPAVTKVLRLVTIFAQVSAGWPSQEASKALSQLKRSFGF